MCEFGEDRSGQTGSRTAGASHNLEETEKKKKKKEKKEKTRVMNNRQEFTTVWGTWSEVSKPWTLQSFQKYGALQGWFRSGKSFGIKVLLSHSVVVTVDSPFER